MAYEHFLHFKGRIFSSVPSESKPSPKGRTGPQFQDANNINAGQGVLIVHSRTKLLHIFDETE